MSRFPGGLRRERQDLQLGREEPEELKAFLPSLHRTQRRKAQFVFVVVIYLFIYLFVAAESVISFKTSGAAAVRHVQEDEE